MSRSNKKAYQNNIIQLMTVYLHIMMHTYYDVIYTLLRKNLQIFVNTQHATGTVEFSISFYVSYEIIF